MNRQQAAIKIAKVNRFIKQMNYWSELGENIHPAAFGDDIYSMSTWVKEIQAYLRTDKNFLLLADLIECVGDISVIDEYLGKRSRRMEEVMRQSLVGLSRNMKALLAECQELRKASKGCYSMLPDPLYNETAIGLLERAVKADILDKEFAPSSKANYNNLKIVAYAVSQIMQFDRKHTYCYFEAMWHKRLSPVMLPSYKKGTCEETMGLFPEVDFTPLLEDHETLVFNCPFSDERKDFLRRELAKHGYIARNTTAKQFFAIFDKDKFKTPVNWLKEQRQLGVLAKLGLGPTNNKNLWLKTVTCFTVNGKRPHKGSLSSGSHLLERTGVLESYDTILTAICKAYNTEANCCAADIDGMTMYNYKK